MTFSQVISFLNRKINLSTTPNLVCSIKKGKPSSSFFLYPPLSLVCALLTLAPVNSASLIPIDTSRPGDFISWSELGPIGRKRSEIGGDFVNLDPLSLCLCMLLKCRTEEEGTAHFSSIKKINLNSQKFWYHGSI